MNRYPGVVLLTCQSHLPFDSAVHMLSPELVRAMKTVIQFTLPDASTRASLWKETLPAGNGR